MKKFIFTLDKMLHYKESLLDREKNKLLEIRTRKNVVDLKIEENERQLWQLDSERIEKAAKGISILEMCSYSFGIETGRRLIQELQIEQEQLEAEVQAQIAVVLVLQQEVSGLEKLQEKQLGEYQYALQKEQELNIGELVSAKYIRQTAAQ